MGGEIRKEVDIETDCQILIVLIEQNSRDLVN